MRCDACNCVRHFLAFVQVVLAFTIVGIVADKLDSYTWDKGSSGDLTETCILGSDYGSSSVCIYTYVLVALSLLLSLVISIVQCCTCNLCGLGSILDVIAACVGLVWWFIGSIIISKHAKEANNEGFPQNSWRNSVVALMWVETVLFAVVGVMGCVVCVRKVRSGGDKPGRDGSYVRSNEFAAV